MQAPPPPVPAGYDAKLAAEIRAAVELAGKGAGGDRLSDAGWRVKSRPINPDSVSQQEEFSDACLFIEKFFRRPVKKASRNAPSSYGFKHMAERYASAVRGRSRYVSNGIFIAAAIHMGYSPRGMWNDAEGPNVQLCVSRADVKLAEADPRCTGIFPAA